MARLSARVNRWLHGVSAVALLAVMLLTVADVVGRWLLNQPAQGTVELTQLALVAIVFLALGRVEDRGEHIAVDLVVDRLPRRWWRAARVVAGLVSVVVVTLVTWQLYEFAGRMRTGDYVTGVLAIPIYPVALLAVAGALAYALAAVTSVLTLIRDDPAPDDRHAV